MVPNLEEGFAGSYLYPLEKTTKYNECDIDIVGLYLYDPRYT